MYDPLKNRIVASRNVAFCLVLLILTGCLGTKRIYSEKELQAIFRERLPPETPDILLPPFHVTPEMQRYAERVVRGEKSPLGKALALVEAIIADRDLNIQYDPAANYTAVETYRHRRGNCVALTHLFIGLSRAVGMKTTYVYVEEFETTYREKQFIVKVHHICGGLHHGAEFYLIDFTPGRNKNYHIYREIDDLEAVAAHLNNLAFQAMLSEHPDLKTAQQYLENALALKPSFAVTHNSLGILYLQMNDRRRAETAFLEACRLDPHLTEGFSNLGALYYASGAYENAATFFQKAIRTDPRDSDLRLKLGLCYLLMGATEQAEKQFLRAIRYDSENCRAWLGLGKISADRRDYRSALKYLEHAADCDAMTGREAASLRRRIMANLCLAVLSF